MLIYEKVIFFYYQIIRTFFKNVKNSFPVRNSLVWKDSHLYILGFCLFSLQAFEHPLDIKGANGKDTDTVHLLYSVKNI